MKKPCRYCYSEVHRSARICPICHNAQTTFGITKSLMMTLFPVLTTIASLGIAYYEKLEKDAAMVQLDQEKLSSTAATQLAEELSESLTDSQLAVSYASSFHKIPTEERLAIVEEELKKQKKSPTLSKDELLKLSKERKLLKAMSKKKTRKNRKSLDTAAKLNGNRVIAGRSPSASPSRFSNSPGMASGNQRSGNSGLQSLRNSNGQPMQRFQPSVTSAVPQINREVLSKKIVIDGKEVTPLVNIPSGLIKEVQDAR